MPFALTVNQDESTLNANISGTRVSTSHTTRFLSSDSVQETLDTNVTPSVSLKVRTLDTSLGFPKIDIQLSPSFALLCP